VLVVDDQLTFRQLAREVIEATPDFRLLGEAQSAQQALADAGALLPDLILLDVRMPDMDGIQAAAHLHLAHPDALVILISVEEAPNLPSGTTTCGAAGFIRKQDFGPAVLRGIWSTHRPGDS
jgi:DNA-binding NarL/FixJ family response regulator